MSPVPELSPSVLFLLLDVVREKLMQDDVHGGMDVLYDGLAEARAALSTDGWLEHCARIREHPLHALLLQSPFTRHAFRKPRGYAGDAALIDFIYGCVDRADGASTLGETVFSWEFELPGFRSVRYRRMYLAREIDRAAALSTTPRVLSVACGHLREAELSATVRDGRVRLFAVDQDRESLALVDREYSRYGVTSALATVVDMLRRRVDIPPLSLAYAAGLYDYLDDNLASVLTLALFRLLDSGGRLFLSNFTPAHRGAGFMEACMDWRLIHRDESQMLAMTARLPEAEIDAMHQFRDPEGNITYLRIVRR